MTRAERRDLYRSRREAKQLMKHAASLRHAHRALELIDKMERDDPRPSLLLRLRLRMAGVDAG